LKGDDILTFQENQTLRLRGFSSMRDRALLLFFCLAATFGAFGCDTEPNSTSSSAAPGASNAASAPKGTVLSAPLPDAAFKAELTLVAPAKMPTTMHPGDKQQFVVRVKNTSSETWGVRGQADGKYQVSLGTQWEDENGKVVAAEETRAPLPADIKPGQETELSSFFVAPAKPGTYTVNIDMLQENVSWFRLKNSTPLHYKITVEEKK
jgi:hypothetical protein